MRLPRSVVVLLLILVSWTVLDGQEPRRPAAGRRLPAEVVERLRRIPKAPHARLDATLNAVVDRLRTESATVAARRAPLSTAGRVAVSIRLTAADREDDLRAAITSWGGRVANVQAHVMEAMVPVDRLTTLDRRPEVLRVRAIQPPRSRVTSQGVQAHNVLNWRERGATGGGVRVGVIDSFQGYGGLVGSEVPAPSGLRCYTEAGRFTDRLADCAGDDQHGTAVVETIADISPEVRIYVANPSTPLDFRATIDWFLSQGVKVINYSAGSAWEGAGDGQSLRPDSYLGSVARAVEGGAVFLSAAGNEGASTWTGPFTDANGDGVLEYAEGVDANPIRLAAGETLTIFSRWDDPWAGATHDIDVFLLNESLAVIAKSDDLQSGAAHHEPFEAFEFAPDVEGVYYVAVVSAGGSLPRWVQVQAFSSQPLGVFTEGYSIDTPADSANPGVITVGAAPWSDVLRLEEFSSRGPTLDGRTKPDIVGADRGETAAYAGEFPGTSQATPHVAGLAALVLQAFPEYRPSQVADFLKLWASPRGSVPNNQWGFGFALLPTVGDFTLDPPETTMPAAAGSRSVQVITTVDDAWTAQSLSPWVTIVSGASGRGRGPVVVGTQRNDGAARTGVVSIAGRSFRVLQDAAACVYALPVQGLTASADGGRSSVQITTGPTCPWTATSQASWTRGTPGSVQGSGSVEVTVDRNEGEARGGLLVVAGQSLIIQQEGRTKQIAFKVTSPALTNGLFFTTSRTSVTLLGFASGPDGIAGVTVQSDRGHQGSALLTPSEPKTVQWITSLELSTGITTITLRARGTTGGESSLVVRVLRP